MDAFYGSDKNRLCSTIVTIVVIMKQSLYRNQFKVQLLLKYSAVIVIFKDICPRVKIIYFRSYYYLPKIINGYYFDNDVMFDIQNTNPQRNRTDQPGG